MHIETTTNAHDTIVRPAGELDFSNAEGLMLALDAAVDAAPRGFILDLTELEYMDSMGTSAMLAAYRKLEMAEGSLAVVVTDDTVLEMFETLGIRRLARLHLCSTIEEASRALLSA